MTKKEILKIGIESYLQALKDTQQIINDLLSHSIKHYEGKVKEFKMETNK